MESFRSFQPEDGHLLLSRLHWPVTTLGYGKRIGIWLQGCSLHCKGCCSRDTWAFDSNSKVELIEVLRWIGSQPKNEIDGFTISGGEPFDQPEALLALVQELRTIYCLNSTTDILVYTGHPWHIIEHRHQAILRQLDAVISEPYVDRLQPTALYGSTNQRVHCLTTLGRSRYARIDNPEAQVTPGIQTHFDGATLWMIGIPKRGDMKKFEDQLAASGVRFGGVSWRG